MKKRLVAGFLLGVFFAGFSWAGADEDFQQGLAAYNKQDYSTALKEWKPLAEQGYAEAQFNLGNMYSKQGPRCSTR